MTKVVLDKPSQAKESLDNVYKDGCNSDSTRAESEPARKPSPTNVPTQVTVPVTPGETDASQAQNNPTSNESNDDGNVARDGPPEDVTETKLEWIEAQLKRMQADSVNLNDELAGTGRSINS